MAVQEHVEVRDDVDDDERRNFSRTPVPGMGRLRRTIARTQFSFVLLLSLLSTIGTVVMANYELAFIVHRYGDFLKLPTEPMAAWVAALVVIFIYFGCKLPHLMGQEPGDYVALCREVLYCVFNLGLAIVYLTDARLTGDAPKSSVTIFSSLLIFFVAVMVIEIVIAMRLTSRSWNQSSGGHI